LINNLIIFFEKNLDQEKIKIKINTILKDNKIDYAISSLEDNYFDYFKIIRIQLYSSYLISFLLFLFSILINFNTLSIFIEQKKRDFLALYLQGFDFFYLKILIFFLIFFSSVIFSFFGGILAFFFSYFFNFFKIFEFNYLLNEKIIINFLPQYKILFFCIFFNFIISIIIYKKNNKIFNLENLNEIINE